EDEDGCPRQEADRPRATQGDDRDLAVAAERERLGDRDRTEQKHDEREEDRVEHDLDDETTHLASSAIRLAERSRGTPFWPCRRSDVRATSAPSRCSPEFAPLEGCGDEPQ